MNIEFKNVAVDFGDDDREFYYAQLYIKGTRAGIVYKDETSANTLCVAIDDAGRELIKLAEQHYLAHPPISEGDLTVNMNLQIKLNLMMEDILEIPLDDPFILLDITEAQYRNLVIGTYENYELIPLSEPIASRNFQRNQYKSLVQSLERVKPLLVDGKKILNDNLNGEIYALTNLNRDQYVKPIHYEPDLERGKSTSLKR